MTTNNPYKFLIHAIAFLAMSLGSNARADEGDSRWKLSGGLGIGMLHAGYGINLAVKNDRNLVFTAVGCGQSAWLYRCGDQFSIGYFRSGLIGNRSRRHAFGLYAGQFERSETTSHEETRGLGAGYVYFANGMRAGGLTLGLGYEVGQTDGRTDHHEFRVQLGFQF